MSRSTLSGLRQVLLVALCAAPWACAEPAADTSDDSAAAAGSGAGSGNGEGTMPVVAMGEVTSQVTNADGSMVTVTSDGTTTVVAADGTITVTAPDGTTTVTTADGMVTTTPGPGGSVGGASDDPAGGADDSATTDDGAGADDGVMAGGGANETPVWINEHTRVDLDRNEFGIGGYWYKFGDGATSTLEEPLYQDGKYCIQGQSTGDSANWGIGIGIDLNSPDGDKLPYEYAGKLTGFRMKWSGSVASESRVHFVVDPDIDVNPFVPLTLGESVLYSISDAIVPLSWEVDNAGQKPEGVIYSLQVLAPGDAEEGPIDLCLEEFEPVFDPDAPTGESEGGAYINSDGFVFADSNDYGIQGSVQVISDGNSTAQTGVPYEDGRYCVSGEFSGAADDWGAGIAIDLNNPPGEEKQAFDPTGSVAAFRVGLSGSAPGKVRVQFIVSEPQEGNQPFLVAQMNTTAMYPLEWAQVPTSWDVSDAGLEITGGVYSLQIYVEGDVPGPFDVCVEDLAPLGPSEVVYAADAAAAGFNGVRTLDPARLDAEYAHWKESHFTDCGDGTACVPRDDGDCISEGIGYGMLLAVGFDDQEAFDQLWAYFNRHKNGNGVMDWQTQACGPVINAGSATDGELDAAMALIQAACKWGGNYESDARALVDAISSTEVDRSCAGGPVLKPGDNFGGCSETNPSYVAPAYYKAFEALTGDAVWSQLTDSGYALLEGNQNRKGGVFSDWSNDTGGVSAGNQSDDNGPDASRVPWRVATDYVWYAEARAVPILDAFSDYVDGNGGVARTFTPNSNYRGAAALSALHQDPAKAAEYTDAWLMSVVDDTTYFPGTLRPIYMMLAANTFAKSCH